MATGISWTDETWNPLRGCRRVSPGCEHCYAERMAVRIVAMGGKGALGYAPVVDGKRWSGKANAAEVRTLLQPTRWRKPRKVFVGSMTDLFYEGHSDAHIDRVWAVIGMCGWWRPGHETQPPHIFQVLTKRPKRMSRYLNDSGTRERIISAAAGIDSLSFWHGSLPACRLVEHQGWPFSHVWCGTSVEDEQRAAERIPWLRETPAAVRFVSFEPLLGPVMHEWMLGLDWAIVGGESGPGARPMQREWVDELLRGCQVLGAPFFFKQWGAVVGHGGDRIDGHLWQQFPPDPVPPDVAAMVGFRGGEEG